MTASELFSLPNQRRLFLLWRVISNVNFFLTLVTFLHFNKSGGNSVSDIANQHLSPSFKSMPTVYKEEVGDTAVLLCKVNNLGDSVIVWKQLDRIISAGLRLIRKDKRMSLQSHSEGVNLQITNLDIDDAGNYICEVEHNGEPIVQTNQLEVLVPPTIETSHQGQNLTVRKDSSLKLSCNASGFPLPRISWQRQHQMLPSGEKIVESSSLQFNSVSRSDSGTYICSADNDVGAPVTAVIDLIVIYPPEIEVDKSWVHGGIGKESVISCLVYGVPQPSVRWYRDTMVLARNENRMMEQFGFRHRLVIASVSEQEFGNFSCVAENELGKSRGFIELSGRPNKPIIRSDSQGMYSDQFNLSWTVDSFSEITDYRINYRKYPTQSNPGYDVKSRWHNIVIPDMILKQHIDTQQFLKPFVIPQTTLLKQGGSYTFFALEPSTKYQVRIQACNKHGWGSFSDEFLFMTTSIGDVPKELPVEIASKRKSESQNSGKKLILRSCGISFCLEILLISLLLSVTLTL